MLLPRIPELLICFDQKVIFRVGLKETTLL